MNRKISLMALGVLSSLLCLCSSPVFAESGETAKKTDKPAEEKIVTVTVKAGDTLDAIAKEHGTTYARLFDANKDIMNPDMIDVGNVIRIPKADEQLPERFKELQASVVQVTPVAYTGYAQKSYRPASTPNYTGGTAGNTYAWGNCTWYAKNKRPDLPNMLGNGGSWASSAAARGYATGTEARTGAVAESAGHVMYVEAVNANDTINISEMNYNGGTGVVNTRTIPASGLNYIY